LIVIIILMKKILFSIFGFLPMVTLAQAEPEFYGSGMMASGYGGGSVWSIFGWLMLLGMIVWIVVGILAALWLWKQISK